MRLHCLFLYNKIKLSVVLCALYSNFTDSCDIGFKCMALDDKISKNLVKIGITTCNYYLHVNVMLPVDGGVLPLKF